MSDHFTETSSQGFFSRFTNSLAGLVIGPLLIIGAIVLLWWNEGRAVQAIVGLKDAASQVVEAQASGPSPANDNRLIHVVGAATAQSPIEDTDVGIAFADQVGVARTAEMYQWKEDKKQETQDNLGGGQTTTTTYDYTREWSDDAINSSEFKYPDNHQNPEMPFRNKRFAASDAKLGGWTLDADTLGKVNYSQMLAPDAPAGWTRSGENYYRGRHMAALWAAPTVGRKGGTGSMLIEGVMLLWFLLTALSVVFVAIDIPSTPEHPVMKWAFVLFTLYSGPFGAFLYVLGCREPPPGMHEQYVSAPWRQTLGSTMHCVAGDGIGILVGAVIGALVLLSIPAEAVLEYILGFAFGWTIFQALFMRDMFGGSYLRSLRGTPSGSWPSPRSQSWRLAPRSP
jgi:hypothetical protein